MSSEIIISVSPLRTWCALMIDGHLEDLMVEDRDRPTAIGALHLGRVRRVNHRLNAAFVDIGEERDGFLPLFAEAPEVHEGEAILVQVNRDGGQDKGARLNREIAIAGHNLVYVTDSNRVMVSKRIENEDRRAQLTQLMEEIVEDFDGSFIVRTAAEDAGEEVLEDEANYLADKWEAAEDQAETAEAPACVMPADDLAVRAVRDWLNGSIRAIITDDHEAAAQLREALEPSAPWALERIELAEEGQSLLESSGIAAEIESLSEARVELPSGGWLAIQPTAALTAIDVNSGRDQRGNRRGDSGGGPLDTNLEAAEEIARQIRLRDLGGLVVVDFLRLKNDGAMHKLMSRLRAELAHDRAHVRSGGPSEFGLVEIQRRRQREDAADLWTRACRACDGGGRRVAPALIADRILAQVAAESHGDGGRHWRVTAEPDVVDIISQAAERITQWLQIELELEADAERPADSFDIAPA